jgi:glycosyltransferase involved in cell wall biosynthesis
MPVRQPVQYEESRSSPETDALSRRLKVAWVAEIPVPYRVGLYRRLRQEAGIDLKLFFCAASQADRDWSVGLGGVPHVVLPGATLGVKPREQFFMRLNPRIWRELTTFAPDVVVVGGYAHLTMQWAMLWCRWTGTPYLINSESHLQRPRGRLLRAVKRLPVRFFVRGAAACLPAGTLARRYLLSYSGRDDRMFALPNTCNVEQFAQESGKARERRSALRRRLGLEDGLVMLYVGRLVPAKGVDTLIRAFGKTGGGGGDVPQLLLVGDGEQRAELVSLTAELGLTERVVFAGSRSWSELPTLYGVADLFVLPSRFEPWGAVVSEAIACGLPVVVTNRVGCGPDLVHPDENGWIVPADDVEALASVLRLALADPVELARRGAASARLAPQWSEASCLASMTAAVDVAMCQKQRD